jgi:hypothetical protein
VGAISVTKSRKRSHVCQASAHDRVRLILDQPLEIAPRVFDFAIQEFAKVGIGARLAQLFAIGVVVDVHVKPARAVAPLAMEHAQVGHVKCGLLGPWRYWIAMLDVLVSPNRLLVAIGARERAGRVKLVLSGIRTAQSRALEEGFRGFAPSPTRVIEDQGASAHSLAARDLVETWSARDEFERAQGLVNTAGFRERLCSDEEIPRSQGMGRIELGEQGERIERRGSIGAERREPSSVAAIGVSRQAS